MVSQSGEITAPPALIAKLAEAFCSYMDTDEHYPGAPCAACVEVAERLAPMVEEELMKPADDGSEATTASWQDGIAVIQRSAAYDIEMLAKTVDIAKEIVKSDEPPFTYNDLIVKTATTAGVSESFALNAVEELINEGILVLDEEDGDFLVYKVAD